MPGTLWSMALSCLILGLADSQVTKPKCHEMADIIFVLDSSLSITDASYAKQLQFVSNLTERFNLGPDGVKFGAIIFSYSVSKLFDLKDHSDHFALSRALTSAPYLKGGTETADALNFVSNDNMFSSMSGGRDDAPNILIVLTDGQSHDPTLTHIAADGLKSRGVRIIAIGIANASVAELHAIASKPENVFQADNYNVLPYIHDRLANRTCEVLKEPETVITPRCFEKADIIFILDSSLSIGITDYQRQLWFAANITKNFKLGPNDTNFGAIIFSDDVKTLFDLKDNLDQSRLWQAITSAAYLNGGTETAKALTWVSNKRMFDSSNGGRKDATRIVIVMTDGQSHSPVQTTAAANRLKTENVKIISIGIGHASETELHAIATQPENVFQAASYDVLHHIHEDLIKRTCELPIEIPTGIKQCGVVLDLVFIMDASSSITLAEFNRQQEFISGFTKYFKLGRDAIQLGAVEFSTTSLIVFDLNDHNDYQTISKAILAAPYLNAATSTHVALKLVRELIFTPERGARQGVQKMVIVMTDGKSSSPTQTKAEAQLLKDQGVGMISITVGPGNITELEAIASEKTNVFQVDDYDDLDTIEQQVADSVCKHAQRIDTPVDIVFLVDSSKSLGSDEFYKQLKFLASMINMYELGPEAAQFSVITYGDNARILFNFDDYWDRTLLQKAILRAGQISGERNTAEGLRLAKDVFNMRDRDRLVVPKLAFVLTNGVSINSSETARQAQLLKDSGVLTMPVATRPLNSTVFKEMKLIASKPGDIFQVDKVEDLTKLVIPIITVTKTEVEAQKCEDHNVTDIIFVFDASGSIGVNNFKMEVEYANHITESFEIGPYDARFGALIFSSGYQKLFDLKDYSDHSFISQALKNANYTGGGTNTAMALEAVSREKMFDSHNGGRDTAQKILMVITDGQSNNENATLNAASDLKRQGITIITVGVGISVRNDELIQMASSPEYVYLSDNYDKLWQLKNATQQICKLSKE